MKKDLQQIDLIEKQIAFLTLRMIRLKRKHRIGIYCCIQAENSLGWHHASECKNNVLKY